MMSLLLGHYGALHCATHQVSKEEDN